MAPLFKIIYSFALIGFCSSAAISNRDDSDDSGDNSVPPFMTGLQTGQGEWQLLFLLVLSGYTF